MTLGPWVLPPGVVNVTPPPPPTYVSVAAQVPPHARASIPPDLDASYRCPYCGHTWTAPERPLPTVCPMAFCDDDHAWLYPLGYPF